MIFEDTDGDGRFEARKVFRRRLEPGQRPGSGLRRRVGRRGAVPAVHSRPRRRRPARRPAGGAARRLGLSGHARDAQHVHLGPRRLALRLPRRVHAFDGRQARHARRTSARRSTPASGATIRRGTCSKSSPRARAIPGASISTTMARRFATACVIPHLYHMIQGGRYQRQAGEHFNPYTYDDIKTIAVHRHWLGDTPHSGNNRSDAAGGGHAHAGAMIYLGGSWPERVSRSDLHEQHPRPAAQRRPAVGQGLGLRRQPGARFLPDARPLVADSQPAVRPRRPGVHDRLVRRQRLPSSRNERTRPHERPHLQHFAIAGAQPVAVDMRNRSDEELVELQLNANDWYVRHARRMLQERGPNPAVRERLVPIAFEHTDETRRLRGSVGLARQRRARRSPRAARAGKRPAARAGLDDSTGHRRPRQAGLARRARSVCQNGRQRSFAGRAALSGVGRRAAAARRALADRGGTVGPLRRRGRPQPAADGLVRRRAVGGPRSGSGLETGRRRQDSAGLRVHRPAARQDRHARGARPGGRRTGANRRRRAAAYDPPGDQHRPGRTPPGADAFGLGGHFGKACHQLRCRGQFAGHGPGPDVRRSAALAKLRGVLVDDGAAIDARRQALEALLRARDPQLRLPCKS